MRAARANATPMRVAGIEQGERSKAMAVVQGWQRMAMRMMRAIVMKTKEVGEEE